MFDLLEKGGVNVASYDGVHMISCYSAAKGERSFSAQLNFRFQIPVTAYKGKLTGKFTPMDIWKRETRSLSWLQRSTAEVRQYTSSRRLEVITNGRHYDPVVFDYSHTS